MEKRKVGELIIDADLTRLRPINAIFVSRYRQAYRSGKDLGEIIIDTDGVIVSGNHRVTALVEEFGPEHEIPVTVKSFGSKRERLEEFARYNVGHGNALSGASQRAITIELIKNGAEKKDAAQLFGVSVARIEQWAALTVMVVGSKNKMKYEPAKHGIEPGTVMDQRQYEEHWRQDRGISAVSQAQQLTRWIQNGWIKDPRSIAELIILHGAIGLFLESIQPDTDENAEVTA